MGLLQVTDHDTQDAVDFCLGFYSEKDLNTPRLPRKVRAAMHLLHLPMLTDVVQGVGEQDLENILELNEAAAEDAAPQDPKPQAPKPPESKVEVVTGDQQL